MKKRVLAVLAATALVGVASAYAANPFADVPTTSWAYQAVTQLASEGVVVGYPDGHFKGERNITRYEMAQIIARAMAKEDRMNAEQQAIINKLANEFSAELNNLGVRVSNLEKKVGNVMIGGDAQVKYVHMENAANGTDKYTSRVRLNVKANVDDSTWAGARFVAKMGYGDGEETKTVTFDRLWVKHNFGPATLTGGRIGAVLGDGLVYDETTDGATLSTNVDKAGLVLGYGYPGANKMTSVTFAQLGGEVVDGVKVAAYAARIHTDGVADNINAYGVAVNTMFEGVKVGAEWAKTGTGDDNTAWTAHAGVGNYDQSKAGTWDLTAKYFDLGKRFVGAHTTYGDLAAKADIKAWGVMGNYALADNLGLEADFYFNQKVAGVAAPNKLLVSLNYAF